MSTDLQEALAQAASAATQLGTVAQDARRRVVDLEMELEEARQELGRRRARSDDLEAVLRRIVEENVEAVVGSDDVLYAVRALLGLDGRTGGRDVNAEVAR